MGIRARILRVTTDGLGPRSRNVLEGLCRTQRQLQRFPLIFQQMLDSGELLKYGDRRGATYGPPKRKRK